MRRSTHWWARRPLRAYDQAIKLHRSSSQARPSAGRSSRSVRLVALAIAAVVLVAPSAATAGEPVLVPVRPSATVYNGAGSAPRIGLIGDSAFAGIGVVGAFGPLRIFNYRYDAVACRRTAQPSCRLGGTTPPNAVSTLRQSPGQWGSLLVMATGYNDAGTNFPEAVDAVMAEAARQGIPRVMWLTLRTAEVGFVPASFRSTSWTFRDNNLILLQKAQQYGGRLVIANWAGYSAGRSDWFSSDGIHFRPAGAAAAAQYVATQARRVLNGENITPTPSGTPAPAAGWTYLRHGMGGTQVAIVQQLLINAGIHVAGGITGTFDVGTFYAVQTFQRRHGFKATGIVDEETARALGVYSGPWTDVRRGASGSVVRRIQQTLIDRGIFVRDGATGTFTIWTTYAVQTFQRRQGIAPSGVVDTATARALGLIQGPEPGSVWTALARGASGPAVARAQQALMDAGIFVRGGADGVFSIYTTYAVQTFQRRQGLAPTGVIDVETAQRLGLFDPSNPVATLPQLGLGSAGSAVAAAERALRAAGVYVRDGEDGVFKLWDYYAVRTFQRLRGLPITGTIDVATAQALGLHASPEPVSTWTNLRMGMAGSAVAAAERALAAAGIYVRDGVDGVFKVGDHYAVQTFQRRHGLAPTGEIDLTTARRLGLLAAPAPAATATVLAAPASATPPSTSTTTTTSTTTSSTTTTSAPVAPPTGPTSEPDARGAIVGRVWYDGDEDGIAGADESVDAPALGVELVLRHDATGEARRVFTDETGWFEANDLPTGSYTILAELPEGFGPTLPDQVAGGTPPKVAEANDSDFREGPDLGQATTTGVVVEADTTVDDVGLGLVAVPAPSTPIDGSTDTLPPTTSSSTTVPSTTAPSTTTTTTSTTTPAPTTQVETTVVTTAVGSTEPAASTVPTTTDADE